MNGAQNEDDLIVIIVNFGVILARTQSYSSSINQTHTHTDTLWPVWCSHSTEMSVKGMERDRTMEMNDLGLLAVATPN